MVVPWAVGRVTKNHGKYKGIGEGPEYEATWGFGADMGVDDFEAISQANFLCNEFGLDSITMATTLALCYRDDRKRNYSSGQIRSGLG